MHINLNEWNVLSIRVRACKRDSPCQAPFDLSEFLRLRRNYPTISKTLPALEYLHPPPLHPPLSPPAGGRGLFKLKSRQDLNFKISIWLANLSASFRPRERTTALPSPPRRGQIARVRHQKSFTSRVLFLPLFSSFSLPRPLLLTLLRKVAELKISSLNGDTRASPTNILLFSLHKKDGI